MHNFLYLRENNIKEIIELMLEAYTNSYSDPYDILKKNSFGKAHHRLICTVDANPGIKVADLIKKLKITKQSLSRVLQELIKKEIISQSRGDSDGRQRLLHLTEKGKKVSDEIFHKQKQRILEAFKDSDSSEVLNFKKVLKKIIAE
ncbi:MAG: MarR family transcriptional regulator [Proteobacteria bacterium]|jgi:DNA-binding MarR family transcriptional regulator|nr:MarR family transcriptional regulator [Pseudomonadota bacterium]MDA0971258.1 MarR family transcriptional regulator [Pseudomonadota bacterium]MDA0995352.1 MarR family transcriptional regulator [Pseudomonadota bacterium]